MPRRVRRKGGGGQGRMTQAGTSSRGRRRGQQPWDAGGGSSRISRQGGPSRVVGQRVAVLSRGRSVVCGWDGTGPRSCRGDRLGQHRPGPGRASSVRGAGTRPLPLGHGSRGRRPGGKDGPAARALDFGPREKKKERKDPVASAVEVLRPRTGGAARTFRAESRHALNGFSEEQPSSTAFGRARGASSRRRGLPHTPRGEGSGVFWSDVVALQFARFADCRNT